MSYSLSPEVITEARRTFAPPALDAVLAKLAATELPLDQGGPPPRIHIAILWLAQGDLGKFDYAMKVAACDWRDALVAAGLANLNWREVLAARGIDSAHWR